MTGFIGVGQLRYILTNLGEKMSDEEVDELLKAVDTSSGEINYVGELFSNPSWSSKQEDEENGETMGGGTEANRKIDLVRTILAN